jgi:N-acetyltransferase 10
MGYGSRALQALNSFYSGEYFNLDESTPAELEYPDPAATDLVRPSSPRLIFVLIDSLTDNRPSNRQTNRPSRVSHAPTPATADATKT